MIHYLLHYLAARAVWHFLGRSAPLLGLIVLVCVALAFLLTRIPGRRRR